MQYYIKANIFRKRSAQCGEQIDCYSDKIIDVFRISVQLMCSMVLDSRICYQISIRSNEFGQYL